MKRSKVIGNIGKFALYESNGRGKSGNATGDTKSIQVREYNPDDSYFIRKSLSYTIADPTAREKALTKAKDYCAENQ